MTFGEYFIVASVVCYWGGAVGYGLQGNLGLMAVWFLYGVVNLIMVFVVGRN